MLITRSTFQLKPEDALYLQPDKTLAALGTTPKTGLDLHTLLQASTRISSILEIDPLGRELLRLILESVPAERGAILLTDTTGEEFETRITLERKSGSATPFKISGTLAKKVTREGIALLCGNVLGDGELVIESLAQSQTGSVLCVPLLAFEGVLGVIYLDTTSQGGRLEEEHLQLMTGIARIAAGAIENARQITRLNRTCRSLREELEIEHNMVGESPVMRNVYQFIAKVAPTETTVLIRGESGTGKELVAHAIHRNSGRAERPFVAFNCAALTETLLESELFGHEKGAFTGAAAQKKGKLEVADGGTVFLDEVGELAPAIQAKLLRVLQTRQFERVGGTRPIQVDIRVIAATNRNLEDAVREGDFRQDLYYRINVVSVTMPPLRMRREDVPLLAAYFAARACGKAKRRTMGISTQARALLMRYDWPGNIRELENAIERAAVLGSGDLIQPEDLPEAILEANLAANPQISRYHDAINELKKDLITKAVREAAGSITEAARILGLHPNHLHRMIRNMGIRASIARPDTR
jgi:Nif-specific regulatory protein